MTADPIRMHIDNHSPTTSFAGRNPAAPKPIDAANLAPLYAKNPPSNVYPPVPNGAAALFCMARKGASHGGNPEGRGDLGRKYRYL